MCKKETMTFLEHKPPAEKRLLLPENHTSLSVFYNYTYMMPKLN